MLNDNKEKRIFKRKQKIRGDLFAEIVVDTHTGVNYINTGYSMTPLLDHEGKPVIDPIA